MVQIVPRKKIDKITKRLWGVRGHDSARQFGSGPKAPTTLMRMEYVEQRVDPSTPGASTIKKAIRTSYCSEMKQGGTRGVQRILDRHRISEESNTHLPPAVIEDFVLLDDLYALAGTKRDFVFMLWGKVVASIDVFDHEKCRETV